MKDSQEWAIKDNYYELWIKIISRRYNCGLFQTIEQSKACACGEKAFV